MSAASNVVLMRRGMPANLDAEKLVLGSVLLNGSRFPEIADLAAEEFALEKHRRIFRRVEEIYKRGERIDHATVANELLKFNELDSVDGLSYLTDLDTGLPQFPNIEAYVRIVHEKAALRRLAVLYQQSMNRCLLAEEDSRVIIEDTRGALMKIYDSNQSEQAETLHEIVREAGGLNGFFASVAGIQSPWPIVDGYTGGWQDGDLVLLGARPSMGKTAFALNLLWHAAHMQAKNAVFYSYEMDKRAVARRLISLITGISYQSILQFQLTQIERASCRQAVDVLEDAPIRIVQASGKSVMALRAHAERLKHKGTLDLIGVDYIGLMRTAKKNQTNRTQELGEIARELKLISMDLQVPVVCLSQLNRGVEARNDKRPAMSDLRDSGEIEEHADLIGFLHRPGYYNRTDPGIQLVAELIIAKQRNGDTPLIELEFLRENGKFREPRL